MACRSDDVNGDSAGRIEALAANWRRRWLLAAAGVLVAIAVAGVSWDLSPSLIAATVVIGALALVVLRPRVDAELVARHLDRVLPSLEESSALLLTPPGGLSPMERAQRARAEGAFAELQERVALPARPITTLWSVAALLLVVACLPWSRSAARLLPPLPIRTSGAPALPALVSLDLQVKDPAYLGGRSRTARGDADLFEGSRLTVTARTEHATAAWLVHTGSDSLLLVEGRPTEIPAERSFLYQVVLTRDTFRVVSEWHAVTVLPDRPPLLTVIRPEERTRLPATPPWRVPVEVLASDDHGVAEARLLATITTGSGESVRFREDTIPFSYREARGSGLLLKAELDLAALGLGPGDELYLSAQAFDGRRPVPNEGRSATLFISIEDTAQVAVADFDGLAVDRMPDYFRSQRQIIIDTEKLLADRPRIDLAEFRRRSNDIGIDQQLLRLRYSEVAGDESAAEQDALGGADEMAHATDPNAPAVVHPNARATIDLTRGEAHSHDIAENATLLGKSTKDLLKLALGEMWRSELQLRTFHPDSALPIERRALEYLEAVRQSARSYVKRVGLDPPPLEPDRKRLTGKLDDVRNTSATGRSAAHDTLPAIRAFLAGRTDRTTLEAAGRELALLAVDAPGQQLATLRDLRAVADGIARGSPCTACEARLRSALLKVLPIPTPSSTSVDPTPAVAARYFTRMRQP